MMKRLVPVTVLGLTLVAGCASKPAAPTAIAALSSTSGSTARGTVRFVEGHDGMVEVTADLTGVPAGVHGFHIHEKADCSDDAKAAGGHFNPNSAPHAAPDAASHHAGDFGNVTAGADGTVHTSFTSHSVSVHEGAGSVVGRAVVLHADPDDLTTQPSGNAGKRIACGAITLSTPAAGGMSH